MKPTARYAAAAAMLAVSACAAHHASAASLMLDLQPTNGTTATGYQALEESDKVIPTTTHNYSAFGTTVGVALTVANLPDGANDFRAVTRNGTATETANDWLSVDTRNTGTDVTLTITLSNLPAGDYTWLSEHRDGGTDTTNGNLTGTADLVFVDASGSTGLLTNEIQFKAGASGPEPQIYTRSFTSNGGDVSFSSIMDNGQGGGGNAIIAFASSIVITQVPEPSSLALLGLGGLMMIKRRRR